MKHTFYKSSSVNEQGQRCRSYFSLLLFVFVFGLTAAQAQNTNNLCSIDTNFAHFGVDADLYANSPVNPRFFNSDGYFYSLLGPSQTADAGCGPGRLR